MILTVKILTGSPETWVEVEGTAVVFVKECLNCKQKFETEDPRKEYHSVECREGAKYIRRVKNGWG